MSPTKDSRPGIRFFLARCRSIAEPKFYSKAAASPKWQDAMAFEIRALEENNTWSIIALPLDKRPIGCK
jgi:hypothetical protein